MTDPHHRRGGFTLVEMLLVVAIIVVLLALAWPTLYQISFSVRFATCSSNLREINVGLLYYTGDYNGWYPTNGTEWVIRHRTFQFPGDSTYLGVTKEETAYETLATYYGWPEPDRKGLTHRNPLWVCPQGVREVEDRSYYSLFSDTWAGISFASYVGPFPAPRAIDNPENLMRRVGQTWKMDFAWRIATGYPQDPRYSIITSDVCHRIGHGGGGMATNHMLGGDRGTNNWGYTALVSAYSWTAQASVNYGFADGSVRKYGPFTWPAMGVPTEMNIGGLGGVGCDPYAVPAAWAESEW